MWRTGLALLLVLGTPPAHADPPAAQDELRELNARYNQLHAAKRYDEALGVLASMAARPDLAENQEAQASIAYARAGLETLLGRKDAAIEALRGALAGGFGDLGTLATDPDLDPLRADPRFVALVAEARQKLRPKLLEWDDPPQAPVFGLRLDDPATPELGQLRSEFGLDAVVAGAAGELEKLVRLTKWTSEQWVHSPTQMASKADPITILREGRAGGRFICRDYAIVTAGAARAFGFASRVISVLPRDVETRSEAHAVAEAWLPGRAKWALADGQYGIVPTRDGVPLNAVELQAALARGEPLVCLGAAARCEEWKWFVGRNLFYFKVAEDQRRFRGAVSPQLVLVPKGAPAPRKFAGGNESVFANARYASTPASFYTPPDPRPEAKPSAGRAVPDRATLLRHAREIATTARFCAFITLGADGRPQARTIDFFPPEDDLTMWLATKWGSRKVSEVRANPRCTVYCSDPKGPAYLALHGDAQVVDDPAEKARRWKEDWAAFYDDRNRGGDYLLIRVKPVRLEIVSYPHRVLGDPKTWRPVELVF